jgi:hypothetical protein
MFIIANFQAAVGAASCSTGIDTGDAALFHGSVNQLTSVAAPLSPGADIVRLTGAGEIAQADNAMLQRTRTRDKYVFILKHSESCAT